MKETQSPPLGFGGVDKKLPRNVPQRHLVEGWLGGCAVRSPPACAEKDAQSAGSEGPGHAGPFTAEPLCLAADPAQRGCVIICCVENGRGEVRRHSSTVAW